MAVKSRAVLLAQAQTIRDEVVANANTATRVGGHEVDVVDSYILTSEANTNYAAAVHTHAAGDVTSGTFVDARIAASNVTQHQAALSITASQVTDFDTEVSNNASVTANTAKVSWTKVEHREFQLSDMTSSVAVDLVNPVGYWNASFAGTWTKFRITAYIVPTGTSLSVQVKKNGSLVDTASIVASADDGEVVISEAFVIGDVFTFFISAIGSGATGGAIQGQLIGTRT